MLVEKLPVSTLDLISTANRDLGPHQQTTPSPLHLSDSLSLYGRPLDRDNHCGKTSISEVKGLRLRGESIIMLQCSEELVEVSHHWPVLTSVGDRETTNQRKNYGISNERCPSTLPDNATGSGIGRFEKKVGGSTLFHLSGYFAAGEWL